MIKVYLKYVFENFKIIFGIYLINFSLLCSLNYLSYYKEGLIN